MEGASGSDMDGAKGSELEGWCGLTLNCVAKDGSGFDSFRSIFMVPSDMSYSSCVASETSKRTHRSCHRASIL
eukprot:1462618-Pyramimonas_sp.AAC.1